MKASLLAKPKVLPMSPERNVTHVSGTGLSCRPCESRDPYAVTYRERTVHGSPRGDDISEPPMRQPPSESGYRLQAARRFGIAGAGMRV